MLTAQDFNGWTLSSCWGSRGMKLGGSLTLLGRLCSALFSPSGDESLRYFVLHLRLPKVCAALTVGASLALAGTMLQNVLNNPLASSFTLGLSQGAAFGASFSMIILPPQAAWPA